MGRFYRTTNIPQLNYAYKLPYSLAANMIQNADLGVKQDLQTLANMQMKIDSLGGANKKGGSFGGQVLPNNQEYYQKRMNEFDEKINELTKKIKEDPLNHGKHFGDILNLRKEITHEFTVGPIAQMRSQYANFQKQLDEDIKRNKKTPSSYIKNIYMLHALRTPGYDEDKGELPTFVPPDVSYADPKELAMKYGKDLRYNNKISKQQFTDMITNAMTQDRSLINTFSNMAVFQGKSLPEFLGIKKKNVTQKDLTKALKESLRPYAEAASMYWRDNSSNGSEGKQPDINTVVPGVNVSGKLNVDYSLNTVDKTAKNLNIPHYNIIKAAENKDITPTHFYADINKEKEDRAYDFSRRLNIDIDSTSIVNNNIDDKILKSDIKLPLQYKESLAADFTANGTLANAKDLSYRITKVVFNGDGLDEKLKQQLKNQYLTEAKQQNIEFSTDPKLITSNSKVKNVTSQKEKQYLSVVKTKMTAGSSTKFYWKDDNGILHSSTVDNEIKNGILKPVGNAAAVSQIPTNIMSALSTITGNVTPMPLKIQKSGDANGLIIDEKQDLIRKAFEDSGMKFNSKDINDDDIKNKISDLIGGYTVDSIEKKDNQFIIHYTVPANKINGKGFNISNNVMPTNVYGIGKIGKGLMFRFTGNDKKEHLGVLTDNDISLSVIKDHPIDDPKEQARNLNLNLINLFGVHRNTLNELYNRNLINFDKNPVLIKKLSNGEELDAIVDLKSQTGYSIIKKDSKGEITRYDPTQNEEILEEYLRINESQK